MSYGVAEQLLSQPVRRGTAGRWALGDAAAGPLLARWYAKKAAAPAKAAVAPAGAEGGKKYRTSETKLYSCRNDRLRHTHEQIWPTLQLTEDEAAMFRRNSRLFVVDMGKPITLVNKYRMSGLPSKVPYQDARALLHEPNVHLDALGENPRYLRIRRLGSAYATKLQNLRKLRLLLGFQRRRVVQKMFEHSLVAQGPNRMWKMVSAMEANLSVFATRMGLGDDALTTLQAVRHNHVAVNGIMPAMKYRGYLEPGDVVSAASGSRTRLQARIMNSLGQDILDDVRAEFRVPRLTPFVKPGLDEGRQRQRGAAAATQIGA